MKHLLKLLSPFAPDQSGAVSVLYELGGLMVICDAGGCAGNICGFDEPRWFEKKSAVFSAGLRDMDAIMGRDDKLIEKTAKAVGQTNVEFTAVIGTPVPAVIATDYKALKRMAERKTSLPSLAIETTGTRLYDEGEEKAYLELFKTFATEQFPVEIGKLGVIGATPLETSCTSSQKIIKTLGENSVCYGMDTSIDDVKKASSCEKNIVIAPSAISTAKYLQKKFGTPYEVRFPYVTDTLAGKLENKNGKKILVIHQQTAANNVREKILENNAADVTVATFFMLNEEYKQENDFHISDEEQLIDCVEKGNYDVIIADKLLKRPLKNFNGEFIDFPHSAVSGRLEEQGGRKCQL